jgi:hypothetical protein
MKKQLKKSLFWWGFIIVVAVYIKFGIIPPRRLSGIELKMHKSADTLELIARDIKTYMKKHNGVRPVDFKDLTEINTNYNCSGWLENYELPTNRATNILVNEKPGLWPNKRRGIYVLGQYGAFMVDEQTYRELLDGAITAQDARIKKSLFRREGKFNK